MERGLEDALAIQRHQQRLAHPQVTERPLEVAHDEVADGRRETEGQLAHSAALQLRHRCGRNHPGAVHVAGAERVDSRGRIGQEEQRDLGGLGHQRGIPVAVEAIEGDRLARLPLRQAEGSGAVDASGRVAVVGAGGRERRGRLDHSGRTAHREVELRCRGGGRDGHFEIAGLLDRGHVLVRRVPERTDRRVEVAAHRRDHIGGSQRRAVVECHAVADPVHPGVGRGLIPRLGEPGAQREVGVQPQQRFAHVREHLVVGIVEGVRVVQRIRLGEHRPAERVDVTGGRCRLVGQPPLDALGILRLSGGRARAQSECGGCGDGDQRERARGARRTAHASSFTVFGDRR